MEKKTALVTGSTGGIGHAIAQAFAMSGHNMICHARKDTEELRGFCKELSREHNVSTYALAFDVTDSAAMKEAVRSLQKEKIPVDILINCAGTAGGNLLAITPMKEIRRIFDVNLFAYMELAQLLVKPMIRRRSGNIINIASFEGINLYRGSSGYGVSKAAVIAWTKCFAKEVGEFGIRVNAIAPGYVETKMAHNTRQEEIDKILQNSAFKRLATPKEIADIAVFLASDTSSFVTGEVLRADGGML